MKKVKIELIQFGEIWVNALILDPNYRENFLSKEVIVSEPYPVRVVKRKAKKITGRWLY